MFEGLVSALGRESSEVGASYIYIAALASVGFYKLLIHISLTLLSLFAEAEYWEDVRRVNAQPNQAIHLPLNWSRYTLDTGGAIS